jgi:hypothetical protein
VRGGGAGDRGEERGLAAELDGASFGAELGLDDELRERLGLSRGESLRLIHSGGRLLLLERTGGPASGALPWDRDLVLTADARAFPLADVLRLLHDGGKSGFLSFSEGDAEKSVYLSRGEVVFASSNQTIDRLGECLLRAGTISLEQLREAEQCWAPPARFGKVLVERGFLTPRELWNGVKHQVEEIVRSLFSHTAGSVCFWEGAVQPDNVVRLSLPTRRLVAEGLQKRDELLRFVATLEDPRVRLRSGPNPLGKDRSANERMIADALETESNFPGLCRRVGLDPLSAARTLLLLCLVGAVHVERDQEGVVLSADLRRHEEDALREHVLDHVRLLEELTAPLVAVEGARGVGERLARVVEETSHRYPELLANLEVQAGGAIDPEVLVQRALRLATERERTVSLALGELVSYMEFELKNSPHIAEPDRFLDAVEDLRAKIEL